MDLTPLVRGRIEDARDQAKRNIESLSKDIVKAELDIERQRRMILSFVNERAEFESALAEAEAMLGDDTNPEEQ